MDNTRVYPRKPLQSGLRSTDSRRRECAWHRSYRHRIAKKLGHRAPRPSQRGMRSRTCIACERLDTCHPRCSRVPPAASRWVSWCCPVSGVRESAGPAPKATVTLHRTTSSKNSPLGVVMSSRRDWILLCAHRFALEVLGLVSPLHTLLTGCLGICTLHTRPQAPFGGGHCNAAQPQSIRSALLARDTGEAFEGPRGNSSRPGRTGHPRRRRIRLCRHSSRPLD